MEDQKIISEKLTRLTKLLEDSLIVYGIKCGANKRALARLLGLQNTRISSVAKVFADRRVRENGERGARL